MTAEILTVDCRQALVEIWLDSWTGTDILHLDFDAGRAVCWTLIERH